MTTRYDNNPTLFIGFTKDRDFGVDDDGDLMVIRRNDWGTNDERLHIGLLTHNLIDNMRECLERLRPFVKG